MSSQASNSPVDERLRKLLIFVGEEGKQFELRDVKHLFSSLETIIDRDIKEEKDLTPIFSFITKAILSVPLKQHLYALMTGYLSEKHEQRVNELLNCVLIQLQASLNTLQEIPALNILLYLSELMNFDILNSFVFGTWIDTLLAEAKKVSGTVKEFYLGLLIKALPHFWKSLDEKLAPEAKKIFERIDKEVDDLPSEIKSLWNTLNQQYQSKSLKDYSQGRSLREQQHTKFRQFNSSFKLSFNDRSEASDQSPEDTISIQEDDELYKEFLSSIEAYIHKLNIRLLLKTFIKVKLLICDKLRIYLSSHQNDSFLIRLIVQILWQETLRKDQSEAVVYSSIITKMASETEDQFRKDFKRAFEEVSLSLFSSAEALNTRQTESFISVVSLYHSNVNYAWEWARWVEQENKTNRAVILRLIFEKIGMLSEFKATPETQDFIPAKPEPVARDPKESLIQARVSDKLSMKADADQLIQLITNQVEFSIFLDILLARMSNSLTHLKKLADRYKKVFDHFNYWRETINCIHAFWEHSQYQKIQYFSTFIEKSIISFEKFAEGISMRAKLSDSVEKLLLKRLYEKVKEKIADVEIAETLKIDLEQSLTL